MTLAPRSCPSRPGLATTTRYVRFMETSSDRKSTRLNSSHLGIAYAVFCLKKKNQHRQDNDASGSSRNVWNSFHSPKDPTSPRQPASCFFFNVPATPKIYTLSLHDAFPI